MPDTNWAVQMLAMSLSRPGPEQALSRGRARQVLLVADDLTGAWEAAVAFAQRGLSTRVALSGTATTAEESDVVAIDTETRDIAPEKILPTLRKATELWNGQGQFFKKIDSMFRGNTFAEIAALKKLFPDTVLAIAPAFPALHRICRNGELIWADSSGHGSFSLLKKLSSHGVSTSSIPAMSDIATMQLALEERLRASESNGQPSHTNPYRSPVSARPRPSSEPSTSPSAMATFAAL